MPTTIKGGPPGRRTRIKPHRRFGGAIVQRVKPDGSFDWFTDHWTKWGAKYAARIYEKTGKIKGIR